MTCMEAFCGHSRMVFTEPVSAETAKWTAFYRFISYQSNLKKNLVRENIFGRNLMRHFKCAFGKIITIRPTYLRFVCLSNFTSGVFEHPLAPRRLPGIVGRQRLLKKSGVALISKGNLTNVFFFSEFGTLLLVVQTILFRPLLFLLSCTSHLIAASSMYSGYKRRESEIWWFCPRRSDQ